jgi:hypothetical protein
MVDGNTDEFHFEREIELPDKIRIKIKEPFRTVIRSGFFSCSPAYVPGRPPRRRLSPAGNEDVAVLFRYHNQVTV